MSHSSNPRWSRLDNAAKIFPSTSSKRDTKVFRFSCELFEPIEPETLQFALDRTMEKFPFYRSVMKKGLFWYYLEDSVKRPVVQPENLPLCAPIYDSDSKELLFRVFYYKRRISLEVYHAISDGTGALHFLRTMVYYYLLERYAGSFGDSLPVLDYDASNAQKKDDSFVKYYEKKPKRQTVKEPKAFQLYGECLPENRIGVLEGTMSVKALLHLAHQYDATLTVFLTSILLCSIQEGMSRREQWRPVVITIPVNLRNYFPSDSARNFFSVINVGYDFHNQENTLEAVIAHVKKAFEEGLTAEKLGQRLNELASLEHNLLTQLVPLGVKDQALRIANYQAERAITAAFSNVGRIQMPAEMGKFIRAFQVSTSTKRLQACLCSFEDRFTISFTAPFVNTDVQRAFFRRLTGMGVSVEIVSNLGQYFTE